MPKTGTSPTSARTVSAAPTTAAGSPGPFERKTPSGLAGQDLRRGRRRRNDLDPATDADQVAEDGALDAEVVGDDPERRVLAADDVGLGRW